MIKVEWVIFPAIKRLLVDIFSKLNWFQCVLLAVLICVFVASNYFTGESSILPLLFLIATAFPISIMEIFHAITNNQFLMSAMLFTVSVFQWVFLVPWIFRKLFNLFK